uniref:Uncharacterized protein n=1 Tax=Nelumbo nucifera TaxID=4432 RepID=A0A822ZP28_NELNU|nr:TPA_asm: hypothetical protein HUJ06_003349 [Nelumbo nucifera]
MWKHIEMQTHLKMTKKDTQGKGEDAQENTKGKNLFLMHR